MPLGDPSCGSARDSATPFLAQAIFVLSLSARILLCFMITLCCNIGLCRMKRFTPSSGKPGAQERKADSRVARFNEQLGVFFSRFILPPRSPAQQLVRLHPAPAASRASSEPRSPPPRAAREGLRSRTRAGAGQNATSNANAPSAASAKRHPRSSEAALASQVRACWSLL